jgi:2TM domain
MEEQQKDDQLWRMARRRAEFKRSLFSYIIVVSFLWGIWWFTMGRHGGFDRYPWPIWVMLGWGLGLAFQYFKAYNGNKQDLAEQEYERLKKEKGL